MIRLVDKLLGNTSVSLIVLPPLGVVPLDELEHMSQVEVANIVACYSFLVAQGLNLPPNEFDRYLHSLHMAIRLSNREGSDEYMAALYNAIHINHTGFQGDAQHLKCLSWFIARSEVVVAFMETVCSNMGQLKIITNQGGLARYD